MPAGTDASGVAMGGEPC